MTRAAPLAIISALPVFLGCALLGASEARADAYVVTIEPGVTSDTIVATSNGGDINTNGLVPDTSTGGTFAAGMNQMFPSIPRLSVGDGSTITRYFVGSATTPGTFVGPSNFGTGDLTNATTPGTGLPVSFRFANPAAGILNDLLWLPAGYTSETDLGTSTATFPGDFASLVANGSLTPGTFTWTWGGAQFADQSFTIVVVPGPVVGAGLPGLIAALGGLVAMARRRRKQLA